MVEIMREIFLYLCVVLGTQSVCQASGDIANKTAKVQPRVSAACKKIQCPPVSAPLCVRLKYLESAFQAKTIYVVLANRCEMKYVTCHEGVEAKELPMVYCDHGKNITSDLKKLEENRRVMDDNLKSKKMQDLKKLEEKRRAQNDKMLATKIQDNNKKTNEKSKPMTPDSKLGKIRRKRGVAYHDNEISRRKMKSMREAVSHINAAKKELFANRHRFAKAGSLRQYPKGKKAYGREGGEMLIPALGRNDESPQGNEANSGEGVEMVIPGSKNYDEFLKGKEADSGEGREMLIPGSEKNGKKADSGEGREMFIPGSEKNGKDGDSGEGAEVFIPGTEKNANEKGVYDKGNEAGSGSAEMYIPGSGKDGGVPHGKEAGSGSAELYIPGSGKDGGGHGKEAGSGSGELYIPGSGNGGGGHGKEAGSGSAELYIPGSGKDGGVPHGDYDAGGDRQEFSIKSEENVKHEEVDMEEYKASCPKTCPAKGVMLCARCRDGVYRTFISECHMRMFDCGHPDEKLTLISREPCAMSAPYLEDQNVPKGRLDDPEDDDVVLRYLKCKEYANKKLKPYSKLNCNFN